MGCGQRGRITNNSASEGGALYEIQFANARAQQSRQYHGMWIMLFRDDQSRPSYSFNL